MRKIHTSVVHPWQCDSMGHLSTRNIVAIFDDAAYHYIFEVFGWVVDDSEDNNLGWADVHHEIDYLAELRCADLVEVFAQMDSVGNKSISIRYEARCRNRDVLAAKLLSTSVLFDLSERTATTLTDGMKAAAKSELS